MIPSPIDRTAIIFRLLFSFSLLVLVTACGPAQENLRINSVKHFKQGNHYFEQKNYLKALDEYDAAIQLDKTQAVYFYNRGLTLHQLRMYRQAEKAYLQALEIDETLAEAWHNLALVYDKLGESERAFMSYEKYQKQIGSTQSN